MLLEWGKKYHKTWVRAGQARLSFQLHKQQHCYEQRFDYVWSRRLTIYVTTYRNSGQKSATLCAQQYYNILYWNDFSFGGTMSPDIPGVQISRFGLHTLTKDLWEYHLSEDLIPLTTLNVFPGLPPNSKWFSLIDAKFIRNLTYLFSWHSLVAE